MQKLVIFASGSGSNAERIATYFDEAEGELPRLSVDATPLRDYAFSLLNRNK